MGQRETLVENCEEAFFRLLMAEYMEKEGEKYLALNEALKRDPGAVVSPQEYEKGLQVIRSTYIGQRRRRLGRTTWKIMSRVAVIACCLILLFATAFAVSPEVRQRVYDLVVQTAEECTDFLMTNTSGEVSVQSTTIDRGASLFGYTEPVIPEGFWLQEEIVTEKEIWRRYSNEDGTNIKLSISVAAATMAYGVDTENPDVIEPVVINDFEGYYVEKEDTVTLYLANTVHGVYVTISGVDVSGDVLCSIVQQMSYIG